MTLDFSISQLFQTLQVHFRVGAPKSAEDATKLMASWKSYCQRTHMTDFSKLEAFGEWWIANRKTWPAITDFAQFIAPKASDRPSSFRPVAIVQEVRSLDGMEIVEMRLWLARPEYRAKDGEHRFETEQAAREWLKLNRYCVDCGTRSCLCIERRNARSKRRSVSMSEAIV